MVDTAQKRRADQKYWDVEIGHEVPHIIMLGNGNPHASGSFNQKNLMVLSQVFEVLFELRWINDSIEICSKGCHRVRKFIAASGREIRSVQVIPNLIQISLLNTAIRLSTSEAATTRLNR